MKHNIDNPSTIKDYLPLANLEKIFIEHLSAKTLLDTSLNGGKLPALGNDITSVQAANAYIYWLLTNKRRSPLSEIIDLPVVKQITNLFRDRSNNYVENPYFWAIAHGDIKQAHDSEPPNTYKAKLLAIQLLCQHGAAHYGYEDINPDPENNPNSQYTEIAAATELSAAAVETELEDDPGRTQKHDYLYGNHWKHMYNAASFAITATRAGRPERNI